MCDFSHFKLSLKYFLLDVFELRRSRPRLCEVNKFLINMALDLGGDLNRMDMSSIIRNLRFWAAMSGGHGTGDGRVAK